MPFNHKTRKLLTILLVLGWGRRLGYYLFRSRKPNEPPGETGRQYRSNRVLMGTFWEVTSPRKEASEIVFAEAERLEGLLSKYIPESEVSRLNLAGELKVSPDTFYLIKTAGDLAGKTEGAFEISIAPLVDLWGFSNKDYRLPANEEINKTLKLVGSDKIILHENNNMVKFKFPGMKIDLGGIAKGYALDCAGSRLKERGITDCLINAGGQVYALGRINGEPWKIAVKNPRKPEISRIVELENKSVSTSGDYEQFFFDNGKRYCHILNPKTGYPADSGIASVTVIDKSAMTADVLSTSAFILGEEGTRRLKENFPEAEFFLTTKEKP